MAKTKKEKKEAKALRIQQKEQNKFNRAAADGKITRKELGSIFGPTGRSFGDKTFGGMSREDQATKLAQYALGNPNVRVGKGVTEQIGLSIGSDKGGRFATYTPAVTPGGTTPAMGSYKSRTLKPNFGKYNTSWMATAGGKYRFGGMPSYSSTSGGNDTLGYDDGGDGPPNTGLEYLDTGGMGDMGGQGDGGTDGTVTNALTPGMGDYDLTNWATGYRSKQSSRRQAGASARTLSGSTRVMPSSNTLGI